MSSTGLIVLSQLEKVSSLSEDEDILALFVCLASFTYEDDPWNCRRVQQKALALINTYLKPTLLPRILTRLLSDWVKPLFAKSRSSAITPQGRKSIKSLPTNTHSDFDIEAKPWKYRKMYIVTVFQWILKQLNVRSFQDWTGIY